MSWIIATIVVSTVILARACAAWRENEQQLRELRARRGLDVPDAD